MRIVHVNDIAHVATVLATAQRRRGDDVELLDPPKPGASMSYPWKLAALPLRVVPLAAAAWHIRRRSPDVAHVHYAPYAVIGRLAGRPWLVHCHGSDVRGVRAQSASGRYLRWAMARAGAVLYATVDLADWVRPLRGDAEYLPNPIDTRMFSPSGEEADRDVLLGTRLHPIKGAEVAIEALRRLRQQRPGTTLTVIADGPLAVEAREAAGPDALVLPLQEHAAMAALLRRHRVSIGQFRLGVPGQFELESMASGVPVVANLTYGASYDQPPPIVQAADAQAVADALALLLDHAGEREVTAARSRTWVERNHGVDSVLARLDVVYGRLAEPGDRSLRP